MAQPSPAVAQTRYASEHWRVGGVPSLREPERPKAKATREAALAHPRQKVDAGEFRATLARRIAIPTESQNPERGPALRQYLEQEIRPAFEAMGFTCRLLEHPKALAPFLVAERIESPQAPTVLGYGHGDVIRGLD